MTRNVRSFYAAGLTSAGGGEGTYVHAPLWGGGLRRDGTQRLVIVIHGHGGTAAGVTSSPSSLNRHMAALVRQGWVAAAGDFSGVSAWSDDAALSALDALYGFGTGTGNSSLAGTTKLNCQSQIDILGWSMGGLTALNWIKRNPTKVRRAVLWAPATQIRYFHDNSGTFAPEIEADYGGAANWQTGIVGHEPSTESANYRGLPAIRIYHGDADSTVPIQQTRDFVASVADPNIVLHELAGRTHTDLFDVVSTDDVADFLLGKVAA